MQRLSMILRLAARDWLHERSLSLCAVLALASMLGPLLILQGVKNGVIDGMRERLLEDPAVLVITPAGSAPEGGYPASFIDSLRTLPGARFSVGRTRDIATDITLNTASGRMQSIGMEPCAPGEPVLEHYHMPVLRDGDIADIVLSSTAAQSLGVSAGDALTASLGRRTPEGQLQSVTIRLHVAGILPPEASGRRMGFLPLTLLEDIQDYRDYIAVPKRGYEGRERKDAERRYASFRLYAQDLNAVEGLAAHLAARGVDSRTRARDIANIRALETAISRVILVISLAVGAGFTAFTFSSVQGAVRRKDRMLAMLRLLGFSRTGIIAYPFIQTLLTSLCGIALAGIIYLLVSFSIDQIFAEQIHGAALARLAPGEYLAAGGLTLLIALIAAARASIRAASIEPSSVLREV